MPKFEVKIGPYRFAPRLIPTLAMLVLLPLLLSLGFWQLDRAQQKRLLLQKFQMRQHLPPFLSLAEINAKADIRYYPIRLQGIFDNSHSLLLDNQFYQHQPGYYVITPFLPLHQTKAILVNRGWIPQQGLRTLLPKIPVAIGIQEIQGLIQIPTAKPFTLGPIADSTGWPWRIETLQLAPIQRRLGYEIAPFVVLLNPSATVSFKREWLPVNTAMPPQRHVAYAVQWFALALTLLIIYLVVNTKRREIP